MATVYGLTHPVFKDYVKVGKTPRPLQSTFIDGFLGFQVALSRRKACAMQWMPPPVLEISAVSTAQTSNP